jgi:hypothetical protein
MTALLCDVDRDGHAGNAQSMGATHGKRLNVEPTPPKKRSHAIQHTRPVVDVNRKRLQHCSLCVLTGPEFGADFPKLSKFLKSKRPSFLE